MSLDIDDEKLLQKYKIVWAKIEGLESVELNALLVYHERYMKPKVRTYDKVYTNFRGLNVPENAIEYDVVKSNNSKECISWHHWSFNHWFKFSKFHL